MKTLLGKLRVLLRSRLLQSVHALVKDTVRFAANTSSPTYAIRFQVGGERNVASVINNLTELRTAAYCILLLSALCCAAAGRA